jgi:hypothetical protein
MNADRVSAKKEKLIAKGNAAAKSGDQTRSVRLKKRVERKENRLSKNTPASKGRTPGGIVDAKAKGRTESFSDKPKAGEMAKKQEYKPAAKKPSAPAKKTKPVAQKPKPTGGKNQSAADVKSSVFGYRENLEAARATVLKSGKK